MLKDINNIILIAKELRPGTIAYEGADINSIDFSRYKFALQSLFKVGNAFIRNSNINKEIMIQDPKQYHRKTLDALHYHEYYIDHSPYWQEYPKRYNSLIFLSYNRQKHNDLIPTKSIYGKYTYLLFPENNCRITVSPSEDFIFSFKRIDINLYKFNQLIYNLYLDIYDNKEHYLNPESYAEWKDMLMNMQSHFKEKYDANPEIAYKSIRDLYLTLRINKEQFYDILLNGKLVEVIELLFSPSKNNFFLVNCDENGLNKIDNGHECWTDGTCLMIRHDLFDWGELIWLIKNKI